MSIPENNKSLSGIDISTLPQDVLFGNVMYDAGGTHGPRVQQHIQLVVIRRGGATVYIDGLGHYLGQGEIALLKPGHEEYFEFAKTTKTYHSWCEFLWDLPSDMLPVLNTLPFKTSASTRTEQLIDFGLSMQHDPQALLPSLAHVAATTFWEYVRSSGSIPASENVRLPDALKRVQAYVRQNYYSEVKLRHLSEVAFVTPEHLSRLFKKHLDTTPMRHLRTVRINQGISFLTHTGLTVEKIAFQCGFKTAAHFSRCVKQDTGQTPSEIRVRHSS